MPVTPSSGVGKGVERGRSLKFTGQLAQSQFSEKSCLKGIEEDGQPPRLVYTRACAHTETPRH